jgi:hypothetical protein
MSVHYQCLASVWFVITSSNLFGSSTLRNICPRNYYWRSMNRLSWQKGFRLKLEACAASNILLGTISHVHSYWLKIQADDLMKMHLKKLVYIGLIYKEKVMRIILLIFRHGSIYILFSCICIKMKLDKRLNLNKFCNPI